VSEFKINSNFKISHRFFIFRFYKYEIVYAKHYKPVYYIFRFSYDIDPFKKIYSFFLELYRSFYISRSLQSFNTAQYS